MATSTTSSKPKSTKKVRRAILGKKLGMTQVYSESGRWIPVTVLQAGPCTVLQVKTLEGEGYSAVQLGFDETKKPRKRPQQARLEKLGLPGTKFVHEVPFVDPAQVQSGASPDTSAVTEGVVPGTRIGASSFRDVKRVDVRGVTRGRGFQGVIRRHHFNAGPKSRGTKNIREMGSTGMHTDPARVIKGKKMPGHLGAVNRKARNLDVVKIDETDNLIVVRGSVPGPRGGYVYIEESLVEA